MKTNKKASPATPNQSVSGLKSRTAQHIENELPKIDRNQRSRNRSLRTDKVLELLRKDSPDFWNLAEVVGKWVWIQFEDVQPPQVTSVLSQLGFHWNNRRQLWQHPCGEFSDSANFDPRRRYGSFFPADQQAA